MDTQDRQNKQDEKPLHAKLTRSTTDAQDYGTTDSQKKSCISCSSM